MIELLSAGAMANNLASAIIVKGVKMLALRLHNRVTVEKIDLALRSLFTNEEHWREALPILRELLPLLRQLLEREPAARPGARGCPPQQGPARGESDLGNLGIAYADLGETRRAIEYHEQSLVILREIGDRRG